MIKKNDLITAIETSRSGLSKSHKLIADYIISNYAKAAGMTASELGRTVGVSESTVVRFAYEMGCEGYPQFLAQLRECVRIRLTSLQRMDETNNRMDEKDVLDMILKADAERIKMTLNSVSKDDFFRAADLLLEAKNIYILGMRASAVLADYMRYYFALIFDNVKLIRPAGGSEILENLMNIGEGDVFVSISFPRYTTGIVNATEYASKTGASVIAITDSDYSPIVQHADIALLAKSEMASFADSLVAPMSLINALIAYMGKKKHEEITEKLGKLEQIWKEFNVYTSVRSDR